MNELLSKENILRWGRFLIGGLVNTGFTYVIYLLACRVLDYQVAYFIAYALGVVFSYCFNALIVFKVKFAWKGLFAYPLIYVVQYSVSAFGLGLLVELLGMSKEIAPLFIIMIMLPITYVMSRWLLMKTSN